MTAEDKLRLSEQKLRLLADELKLALAENSELKGRLAVVELDGGGVWRWQPGDEVSTLSCPVVMEAGTLRALLRAADIDAAPAAMLSDIELGNIRSGLVAPLVAQGAAAEAHAKTAAKRALKVLDVAVKRSKS